jgi:hypothetical protein
MQYIGDNYGKISVKYTIRFALNRVPLQSFFNVMLKEHKEEISVPLK